MPTILEALGRNQPFVKVQPPAIVGQRAPASTDTDYPKGQVWLDESASPAALYTHIGGGTWDQGGNAVATNTVYGIVQIDSDGTLASADDDHVPTALACKTYADSVAVAGAPVATEAVAGIGELATDAEAVAGTASTPTKALFVTPSNLDAYAAAPGAIGGTTAAAGTFTALTADGTGAVSLTGNAASTLTNSAGDLTVDSQAGSLILDSGEATADAVRIVASNAAGGIDMDSGTGGIAIDSTDAISIDAAAASNFSCSAGDMTIDSAAGSLILSSGEDVADSIQITADAGGIDITCSAGAAGQDIDIVNTGGSIHLSATEGVSDAINIDATAGGVDIDAAGQVNIASSQNAADSIVITSSAGGIDILAPTSGGAGEDIDIVCTGGSVNISGTENVADAITLSAANGGIDMTCGGAAGEDIDISNTSGSVNITAGEAIATAMVLTATNGGIDLTAGGGAAIDIDLTCTSGSINLSAGEAAADAVTIDASNGAGGVQISAGTGGILVGNQADCTTIDVGDFAPTASRTITVGGGTVVTAAVTDLIDIAPDGATTNADSVKQVDILTGTVATGQSLLNLATGTITSGTHTVSIQSGNAAAGTVACNISTGTGTKTVNVGNADAGTTVNIDGVFAVNNNINANASINDGTSTGTVTIGNGAAGAITVDSGAGISIDAATASNFACAAGDMTVDAAAGSLVLHAGEAAADSIQITSDVGGIDLTCSAGGAGLDIDLTNTGGSINLSASEAVGDAVTITASNAAGGIDFSAGTGGISFDSGITMNVTSKSNADTPYTVLGGDYYIDCDTSAGVLTVTLPDAAVSAGRIIVIKDHGGSAGANNITIGTAGGNLVGGGAAAATKTISANYAGATCISDGATWGYFYVA